MEYWLFLRVISQRKWLIICIIAVALVGVHVSNLKMPTPVEAKTSIIFNYRMPQDVDVFGDDYALGPTISVANYNFLALFESNEILEAAYERAASKVDLGPVTLEVMRQRFKATLHVLKVGGQEEQTSVIDIIVTLRNEERAIAICESLAEVAIQRYKQILTNSVVRSREYLEEQVLTADRNMKIAQNTLETFIVENPEFTRYLDRSTFTGETIRSESNIVDIEVQLATLNTHIKLLQKEIDDYTKNPTDQIPVSIQASILISNLRSQLVTKQLEIDQLRLRYKDDYPQIKRLKADMAELRSTLYSSYITLLSEKFSALKVRQTELLASRGQLESVQSNATTQYNVFNIKQLKYNELVRDLGIAENDYRQMREKLDEAKIREDEAKNRYTLTLIDSPRKAYEKQEFYFKPLFKFFFAFMGSLLFAIVLVFLMDYFEVRYKTTTDISRIIDVPILGEIPEHKGAKKRGKKA